MGLCERGLSVYVGFFGSRDSLFKLDWFRDVEQRVCWMM